VVELEVAPVIELAANNVRQIMGEGTPSIRVELDGASQLFIEADRSAVNDVVTALVHNAAIAVSGQRDGSVTVAAVAEPSALALVVEDNGPGVPREIEKRLFEPFVTGRGRDAAHPGTGLGLAIALRSVERHGGSLRYEPREGGGARFVVRWPLRPRGPRE
jgi:signal transduction histidine kinase